MAIRASWDENHDISNSDCILHNHNTFNPSQNLRVNTSLQAVLGSVNSGSKFLILSDPGSNNLHRMQFFVFISGLFSFEFVFKQRCQI